MKIIMCLAVLLLPVFAQAEPKLGLGAVLGSPTGLSANVFFSRTRTLHSVFSYNDDDEIYFATHYTVRRPGELKFPDFSLGWFYGGGAQIETEKHRHHRDTYVGPSGTLGLFHEFKTVPIEVFLKSNLAIYVVESTDARFDAMLGVHYNF